MTNKFTLFRQLILASLLIFAVACESDDIIDEPEASETRSGTITIDASTYDRWVYFSFAQDKIVEIDDYTNSLDWDIGFHRQDIRVNCGTSGIGQGGSYDAGQVDFSSVSEAPESGYVLNDSIDIMLEFVMPPQYVRVPGDTLVANWIDISYGQSGPVYNYNDHIYIIRTADAKYAKIWLKNYFSDTGESGFVTMKYKYQSDGSRNLKD